MTARTETRARPELPDRATRGWLTGPFGGNLPFVLSLIGVAVAWELIGGGPRALILPPFSQVVAAWVDLMLQGTLLRNLWLSFVDLMLGFGLSILLGVAVGLLVGRFKAIEELADFYLTITLITPIVALVPVVVIFFKYDLIARLTIIVLFAFPIIAINTAAGVRQVSAILVEMATSFLASERAILLKVVLPGALPGIMSGVRLGFGRAILGTLISEWLLATYALGDLLVTLQGRYETAALFATILTILLASVALTRTVDWVERRLTGWKNYLTLE